MKKRITAKKDCKHLKLDSKLRMPLCTIEPIICTNWFCNVKGFSTKDVKCNLECFRKCAIKNPDAYRVPNINEIYKKTIKMIDKRLEHYKRQIPENELIGGILAYRELEVLRAFFMTPGAFTDVFQAQNLIPKDISSLKEKDIAIKNNSQYFLHLYAMRNVLSMELNRVNDDSLLIYCTPDGLDELKQKMADPESDELLKLTKQGKGFTSEFFLNKECHHIMWFEPLKNYKIIEWCKANNFQREILKFKHLKNLKKIHQHFEDIEITGHIDARVCFDLSYQPYMNSIYALRNIYSNSKKFLRIAKAYKDLWLQTEKLISWPPLWDNSIISFEKRACNEDFLIDKIDIKDNAEYPMHVGKKTFYGSLIMWTFVGKNWDDICSTRWTKGKIFEIKLEKEICERGVNIIDKNIQLSPDDEVDFLCEKNGVFYMIEAKNYGPNWDRSFLSSSKYDDRVEELNSRIALSPRRLGIINSDRKRFKIPSNSKLQGVIITSFIEPHIEVPDSFICISIAKLNKVFGKRVKMQNWRKNPILQIPEDLIKKIHIKMGVN